MLVCPMQSHKTKGSMLPTLQAEREGARNIFLIGNGKVILNSTFQPLTPKPFQSLFSQMKQNLGQNVTEDI